MGRTGGNVAGLGRVVRVEVEWSDALGEYRWLVESGDVRWAGLEPTLGRALGSVSDICGWCQGEWR